MNNLKQKAMLVQLRISMWTGRRKDNAVTEEVCLSKQSEHDAGAWWTYMIPKKDIQPIEKAAGKCRASPTTNRSSSVRIPVLSATTAALSTTRTL